MSIVDLPADLAADAPAAVGPTPGGTQDDWDVSELSDPAAAGRMTSEAAPATEEASSRASEATPALADPGLVRGTRPSFTITEAASACAVSRKTITRKLTDLAGHGAAKDEDGVWRIPVEALLAVGLHPGRSVAEAPRTASARPSAAPPAAGAAVPVPAPSPPRSSPGSAAGPDVVTIPRDRWDDLRLRLARAEAEAAERALALADARLALRALTAGPAPAPTSISPIAALSSATEPSGAAPGVPGVPPAAGWVMGAVRPGAASEPSSGSLGGVTDPGAAPPVPVLPESPRKRRWWQSAAR